MNKDELSELKISQRAEAVHTPQPLYKFSKEKGALPSVIYLRISIGKICSSVLYPWTFEALVKSHMVFCEVPITSRAVEALLHRRRLLARSTLSTTGYENATETTGSTHVALQETLVVWNGMFGSAFIWTVSPGLSCDCFHILCITRLR